MQPQERPQPYQQGHAPTQTADRAEFDQLAQVPDYCALPVIPERVFDSAISPDRAELIQVLGNKWVNGTVLHYYFFDQNGDGENVMLIDGTSRWIPWTTTEQEMQVVRDAFAVWKNVGIGLEFQEVDSRSEAEIRIGFMRGDGAWSRLGRDVLNVGQGQRTMNFGWDLTRRPEELDTAIHEIGHTMDFPHEHQNPNAGIVWNEEKVYAALAGPPNRWDRQKTFHNIIRKLDLATVHGSTWDPNSIMHYPFGPGLIQTPAEYQIGITPAGGLSERDKNWVKQFYPSLNPQTDPRLVPFQSAALQLTPGQQKNYVVVPEQTRYYEMRTFGISDTVMVLFEDENGNLRYLAGDDDSGEDRNAYMRVKLFKGRRYVLRIRMYYSDRAGDTSVMIW